MSHAFQPRFLRSAGQLRTFDADVLNTLLTSSDRHHEALRHAETLGLQARVTHPAGQGTYALEVDDASYADLDALIAGERPDMHDDVAGALVALSREHAVFIDETDVRLMEALGLHLPTCLLMTMISHDLDPGSCDSLQFVAVDGSAQAWLSVVKQNNGRLDMESSAASLARGCFWSHGSLDVEGLPETAVGALAGRPVTDLVVHPIIAPLGLRITAVHDSLECHVVRTDHRARRVAIAEIAHHVACGNGAHAAFASM